MSDDILIEIKNAVMVITLNRANAKNAVTRSMSQQMADALDELDKNPDLRLGILTGAGGTFCAGMDLKAFAQGETPILAGRGFGGLTETPPDKPLIAAIEGYALAGGFELALACDLIIASENAMFGIPEVKRGLVAAAGGVTRLPRQIAPRIALEFALTGEFFNAQRAYELGLINRIVADGESLSTALKLAEIISANAPLAVAMSKKIINDSADWSQDNVWEKQAAFLKVIFESADALEGAKAFAEKRAPKWQGK